MSKTTNTQGWRALACGGLLLAGSLGMQMAAWGGEPAQICPAQKVMTDCQSAWLAKVPYVGRLFVNTPPSSEKACCDGLERIGFDFDVSQNMPAQWLFGSAGDNCQKCIAVEVTACKTAECKVSECKVSECKAGACSLTRQCKQQCASGQTCAASCAVAKCGSAKCEIAQSGANQCSADKCSLAGCGSAKGCPAAAVWASQEPHAYLVQIIKLSSEKASLEAALAIQEAMLEQKAEMLEAFAELAAEKAKLEAQAELQGERDGVTSKMLELANENSRLKAQLELADAKAAFIQQVTQIGLENENLKLQLAQLQLQLKSGSDETRVSKRSNSNRKVR